ncbi:MAG: ribonuclease P protein subunit [Candidatus Aenigmarchaeota archaeon]|nr:ribonuclease P protein subunit [Candidatus Aenigmarchaeota archaeon]
MAKEEIIDFLRGEFIGKTVRVVESSNKDLIGLEGRLVDETRNMFEIETPAGTKKVQKKICKFLFVSEKILVDGKIINLRPENRLTGKFKDW